MTIKNEPLKSVDSYTFCVVRRERKIALGHSFVFTTNTVA